MFMQTRRVNIFNLATAIAKVVDMMNPVIGCHHMQVAYFGYQLADALAVPDHDKFEIFVAGLLHDIGAFSLRERPDLLEFEDDKPGDHAIAGSLIIKRFAPFASIAELIKYHHLPWRVSHWGSLHQERLNGTGYPFGLSADDLPLGARILAVADVFTALTEDRPYRKGMNTADAMAVLQTLSDNEELDAGLIGKVFKNLDMLNATRETAQQEARKEYNDFQKDLERELEGGSLSIS